MAQAALNVTFLAVMCATSANAREMTPSSVTRTTINYTSCEKETTPDAYFMEQSQPRGEESIGRSFEAIKACLSQKLLSTEKPSDFVITLIYCGSILAPVRFCIDCSIFEKLVQARRALQASELLAENDGNTDENRIDLVVRMLRAVTSIALVDEIAPKTYCANELTFLMADPGFAAGFQLLFDNLNGPSSTVTELSATARSSATITAIDGPWQRARGVAGKTTFEQWEKQDPVQLTRLSQLMQRMQPETSHWTEWLPPHTLFGTRDCSTAPFLVDIGGGRGHDLSALAARYPDQQVKLILQDLPSVIQEGIRERQQNGTTLDPRLSLSEHDFFRPQPISGAAIYYMHKIMHDWPDEDCVTILSHVREAMENSSRIFIQDVVLPDQDASLLQAAFDIDMLALHSGKERDKTGWKRLVAKVGGLELANFYKPSAGGPESIIEIWKCKS